MCINLSLKEQVTIIEACRLDQNTQVDLLKFIRIFDGRSISDMSKKAILEKFAIRMFYKDIDPQKLW